MMTFFIIRTGTVQVQTECAEVQVYVQEITDRTVPCYVILRTSSYSYCRTFRTPTTQYCIMILARRGHQTALVQYM